MKRIPASAATRERLQKLFDGESEVEDVKGALVREAVRLIVEEALEGEVADALGRGYYETGAQPGAGYRNGYRRGKLKSAEGAIEYGVPQVADRAEPFRSRIRELIKGTHGGSAAPGGGDVCQRAFHARHRGGLCRRNGSKRSWRDLSEFKVLYLICRRHCRAGVIWGSRAKRCWPLGPSWRKARRRCYTWRRAARRIRWVVASSFASWKRAASKIRSWAAYAALIRASDSWRGVKNGVRDPQLQALREDLYNAHARRVSPVVRISTPSCPAKVSSKRYTQNFQWLVKNLVKLSTLEKGYF
jgi:hypothetical protein